jgi:hypothetical protein
VCAPEVKKKFQKRDMKKRCTRKIYLVEKFCDEQALSGAAKNAIEVVAPALQNPALKGDQLDERFSNDDW